MKTILLPTDFSENSWNAIVYALEMHKDEPCHFFVFNSYAPHMSAPSTAVSSARASEVIQEIAKKESAQGLETIMKRIKEYDTNPTHTFEIISSYDYIVSSIISAIEKYKVDMVVMGTKGASGLKEVMIGSTTANIIEKVKCPVIAVPENAVFKGLNEIAFATDFSFYYNEDNINLIKYYAKKQEATIRVVHVLTASKLSPEKEKVREYLDGLLNGVPKHYHYLTDVSVDVGMRVFSQSREIDLLCMVNKQRSFLKDCFLNLV